MRAVITGVGDGGLGGAICERLVQDALAKGETASMAICGAGTMTSLTAVAERLTRMGAKVRTFDDAIGDTDSATRLLDSAVDFCGGLDAVVSNAEVRGAPRMLADVPLAECDRFLTVNMKAAWLLARAAHPALKAARGSIVAIASVAGVAPQVGQGMYGASKAGLIMLCRLMAQEWARDGIRVNSVSPGFIQGSEDDDALRKEWTAQIPAGRRGTLEEVASAVAFLLSRDAGFVTGQNLVLDGGFARAFPQMRISD